VQHLKRKNFDVALCVKTQSQGYAHLLVSLNLALAGLRLGLKNRQVDEKWVSDERNH
jgi:hypothetical protein